MAMNDGARWSSAGLAAAGRRLWREVPGLAPALLIVGLLACVLVPLPTLLVDLLLSVSLAGAVLMLVASLRVRRTSEFLDFPALLLLVTLFRLALNVSTTRLILSQADAGRVVDAFAGFVVAGDLLVGVVMFGIVTVIQYLVIARGAERVAEVAARFALDGMPGEQAAIDADLRAGAISPAEAAQRRARLGERSSFYGAMDGAVRFVKGDAVAGLVIVAINLCGGVAVGALRGGLSWGESLALYGRLTIGDGLLAQIPALLVSLAAGVLVSRVDRRSAGAVGDETPTRWPWLEPAMLLIPAVLLLGVAWVPGMPWLAFATTGIGLSAVALVLASRDRSGDAPASGRTRRLEIWLHPSAATTAETLREAASGLAVRVGAQVGFDVATPAVALGRVSDPGAFAVELDGRPVFRGRLDAGVEKAAREDEDGEGTAEGEVVKSPGSSGTAPMVAVYRALVGASTELLDLDVIAGEVERARVARPLETRLALSVADERDVLRLARAFVSARLPAPGIEAILRCMAEEEAFRDAGRRASWTAVTREALASRWLPALLEGSEAVGGAIWVRPTPDLEDLLMARCDTDGERARLRLAAAARKQLVTQLGASGPRTVVIVSPGARVATEALLRGSVAPVPVVTTAEFEAAAIERPAGDAIRWVDVIE